ncbi:MAG: class B sortase [Clostridiales bacterium]|nr:class B sortase [Clostridiales bacterium]
MGQKRAKKKRRGLERILGLALLAVLLVSAFMLARYYYTSSREQAANDALADLADTDAGDETDENGILLRYAALWELNHDMVGWLSIEGTVIDYPVMYTPEEPEYYLHRAFDGSDAKSGCLFIGEGSSPDADNIIIYGHHMKNDTMFGTLVDYGTETFREEHSIIRFDTLYELREYEVVAAFYYDMNNDDFPYYQYTDLSDEAVFDEYMDGLALYNIYAGEIDAAHGDQLLTLSTCNYHTSDGRFVVVARRVAE